MGWCGGVDSNLPVTTCAMRRRVPHAHAMPLLPLLLLAGASAVRARGSSGCGSALPPEPDPIDWPGW